ncbi:MAG: VWA domain-containing protein [Clostridiales bacterium]|nr:VWA domain-containing protein [Clostridiales bacterium]
MLLLVFFPARAVNAQETEGTDDSGGVDVMLLLDVSGSMRYNDAGRIVPNSAAGFAETLGAGNTASRVGVIAFSGTIRSTVPLRFASDPAHTESVRASLDRLEYNGYTDFGLAMLKAEEMFAGTEDAGNRKAVLLLTDGMFEINPNTPRRTVEASESDLNSVLDRLGSSVPVYAVGLNDNGSVDADFLQSLAERTSGKMYITDGAEGIPAIFGEINTEIMRAGVQDEVPSTEAPTEAATEPVTELATEVPGTEAPTEAFTEAFTEGTSFEAPTTEASTEVITEEVVTEPVTEVPGTEAPTEAFTEAFTEGTSAEAPATEASPEVIAEEVITEPATEVPGTEAPAEPATGKPFGILDGVLIFLVAIGTAAVCYGLYRAFLKKASAGKPVRLLVKSVNADGDGIYENNIQLDDLKKNSPLSKLPGSSLDGLTDAEDILISPVTRNGKAALLLTNKSDCEISDEDNTIIVRKKILWAEGRKLTFTAADPQDLSHWEITLNGKI